MDKNDEERLADAMVCLEAQLVRIGDLLEAMVDVFKNDGVKVWDHQAL